VLNFGTLGKKYVNQKKKRNNLKNSGHYVPLQCPRARSDKNNTADPINVAMNIQHVES
jgi:hypothetical protein